MLLLLTRHCSMGCLHCGINAGPDGLHAHESVIDKTMQFNLSYGINNVICSGGEPTEHPNFYNLFKTILDQSGIVVLATNGSFLTNHAIITQIKSLLTTHYNFHLQITSVKGLYPKYDMIVPLIEKFISGLNKDVTYRIAFVEELHFLDEHSGRAKKNDLSAFRTGNKRTVPECFNLYALSQQLPTLDRIINEFQVRGTNQCKPVVHPDGTIHPCASFESPIIGNIYRDWNEVYKNLRKGKPCGACKNEVPNKYKRMFGW